MARVDLVFTLTDRVTRRLDAIIKRMEKLNTLAKNYNKELDETNEKLNKANQAVHAFSRSRATAHIDANINPLLRKLAAAQAAISALDRNVNVGGRGGGGVPIASGGFAGAGRPGGSRVTSGGAGGGGSGGTNSFVAWARQQEQMRNYRRRVMSNAPGRGAFPPTQLRRTGNPIHGYVDPLDKYEDDRRIFPPGDIRGAQRYIRKAEEGRVGSGGRRLFRGGGLIRRGFNQLTDEEGPFENFFVNRILKGGRGGWFHGASLIGLLAATGGLGIGAGGINALGAGAASLLPMMAAGGGLLGSMAAVGMPLAMGAAQGQKRIQTAQEALAAAKTPEEAAAALEELRAAQAALTPVQRQVIKDFERLKKAFKDVTEPLQPLIARTWGRVANIGEQLAPRLAPHMKNFLGAGDRLAARGESFMSDPREMAMLNRFLAPLPHLAEQAGVMVGRLGLSVMRLATAATPLADWVLDAINGQLATFLDNTKRTGGLEKMTRWLNMWRPVLSDIGGLIKDVFNSLVSLGPEVIPITRQFIAVMRGPFLKAFESVVKASAQISGPAVLGALSEILLLIADVAPEIATIIKYLAQGLEWLVRTIRTLNAATGGSIEWFIGGLAGITIIAKFLKLFMGMTNTWKNLAKLGGLLKVVLRGAFALGPVQMFAAAIAGLINQFLTLIGLSKRVPLPGMGGKGNPGANPYPPIGTTYRKKGESKLSKLGKWAGRAAAAGAPWLARGALAVGGTTAGIAAGVPLAAVTAASLASGRGGPWNIFDDPTPGTPTRAFYRGGGSPFNALRASMGQRATATATGGTAPVVNFNAPININNGTDEAELMLKIQRAVQTGAQNMPQP